MAGYWPTALEQARRLRASLPADRVVDVRHPDLARDPIRTVEGIYRGLGLCLTEEARGAMREFVTKQDETASGRHTHALEGFGLTREGVRGRFARYCQDLEL